MKTHKVIRPDFGEKNILFVGTSFDCQDAKENIEKIDFSYKNKIQVVNLTTDEIDKYNNEELVWKDNENDYISKYNKLIENTKILQHNVNDFFPKVLFSINSSLLEQRKIDKKIQQNKMENIQMQIFKNTSFGAFGNISLYNPDLAKQITKDGIKNLKELKELKGFENLQNLDEAMFIKQKICFICLNCKSYFIDKPEQCSVCLHKTFQTTDEGNKEYAINLIEVLEEYRKNFKTLNLNEIIEFIPNEKGIKIIYEFKNKWITNPEKYTKIEYPLETILNEIDFETGKYKMQLWEFINCFGISKSLGNGFDSPFKENNIFINKDKFQ